MTTLHIHAPAPTEILRKRKRCPTCKAVSRFVVVVFEWYDPEQICCRCGERWEGSEMAARPFERGWRKRSIARARQLWKEARPR